MKKVNMCEGGIRYNFIDVLKIVLAVFVVALHTRPFTDMKMEIIW